MVVKCLLGGWKWYLHTFESMQIGYTLPSQWVTPAGIKKVRFYVSGGNLLTFSHLKHLDPEMPSVNQGYYPQQRTYELGLNVTF